MDGVDPRAQRSLRAVVDALAAGEPLTRGEIQARTGLALGTIASVVAALKQRGQIAVLAEGQPEGRRGRPAVRYQLAEPTGVVVGLLVGHDAVDVVVMTAALRLLARSRVVVPAQARAAVVLDLATDMCRRVLRQAGRGVEDVLEAAVAVPAPVDPGTGEVPDDVTVVAGWRETNPARLLAERLGCPVTAVNDANAAALEECRNGEGIGVRDLLYLECSRGLGGAVVMDGRILPGWAGRVGEIGHVRVPQATDLCGCGQRGCLESEASTVAMATKLRAVLGRDVTASNIAEVLMAERGNTAVDRLLYEAGVGIGTVLASMCNLLAPERVVLGGELAAGGEPLRSGVVDAVHRYALAPVARRLEVRLSRLGSTGPALGAAALAANQVHAIASGGIGFRAVAAMPDPAS